MSYTVLARKWRPQNFHQMVGQEHVLKALINALDREQLHHAYLFTGTRGVGKTSIARILAKCLNCETGVSSKPCGTCTACTEIVEGRHVDLIEVDAASRTKVEDTRELLENVQYAPSGGRFKVYLIDEVHMLSTHSFNALLKTLEEPPPHVKFLLATTDPQKLPATILSRCLQFHLKNLSPERVVGHLQSVLDQESVAFDEPALWQIGRAADGSMRDALSLTDQAIAYSAGEVRDADVRAMLGSIDQRYVHDMLVALVKHNGRDVLAAVDSFAEHAPDYLSALDELISLLHRIAVAQTVPEAVDNSLGDRDKIVDLASQVPAEDVQLFYQIGLQGKQEFPYVPDPRSALEMTLLRMLAFKPEGVLSRPDSDLGSGAVSAHVGETNVGEGLPREAVASVKKPEAALEPEPVVPAEAKAVDQPLQSRSDHGANEQKSDLKPELTSELAPEQAPEQKAAPQQISDKTGFATMCEVEDLPSTLEAINSTHWVSLFKQLPLAGVERAVASNCVLLESTAEEIRFVLNEKHSSLYSDMIDRRLAAALTDYFQKPVRVVINPGQPEWESPAVYQARIEREKQEQAVENIREDPNVRLLLDQCAGELDMDSIRPINE